MSTKRSIRELETGESDTANKKSKTSKEAAVATTKKWKLPWASGSQSQSAVLALPTQSSTMTMIGKKKNMYKPTPAKIKPVVSVNDHQKQQEQPTNERTIPTALFQTDDASSAVAMQSIAQLNHDCNGGKQATITNKTERHEEQPAVFSLQQQQQQRTDVGTARVSNRRILSLLLLLFVVLVVVAALVYVQTMTLASAYETAAAELDQVRAELVHERQQVVLLETQLVACQERPYYQLVVDHARDLLYRSTAE
jgi:cell division protein FtsB